MSETVNEEMGNTPLLTNSSTHLPNTPIIQVKHLSKRYQIGMDRTYKTFCETAVDTLKSPLKRLKSFSRQEEVFWALKDINFEVFPGEVVGIIGRNGAGKSTLLKILSCITHLTEGEIILRGRVASLLEVGTGFHPELTGRENIYFNGAILGMTKREIEDKFDEIVEFSGVEKFLDTPLKRYSSGMQVRLAFAVAAHLEPEILLVDEVLAVGDVAFQQKCMGKMGDVAKEGRTVLFVSHNMSAIRKLCPSVILLEEGRIALRGDADQVIDQYLSNSRTSTLSQQTEGAIDHIYPRDPSKAMQIRRVRILDPTGTPATAFDNRYPFTTELEYEVLEPKQGAHLEWILYKSDDSTVCESYTDDINPDRAIASRLGSYVSRLKFPGNILNAGLYRLGVEIVVHDRVIDRYDVTFSVVNGQSFGQALFGQRHGVLLMPLPWQVEMRQPEEGRLSE